MVGLFDPPHYFLCGADGIVCLDHIVQFAKSVGIEGPGTAHHQHGGFYVFQKSPAKTVSKHDCGPALRAERLVAPAVLEAGSGRINRHTALRMSGETDTLRIHFMIKRALRVIVLTKYYFLGFAARLPFPGPFLLVSHDDEPPGSQMTEYGLILPGRGTGTVGDYDKRPLAGRRFQFRGIVDIMAFYLFVAILKGILFHLILAVHRVFLFQNTLILVLFLISFRYGLQVVPEFLRAGTAAKNEDCDDQCSFHCVFCFSLWHKINPIYSE